MVIIAPGLEFLPIPPAFRWHLDIIPRSYFPEDQHGCNWNVRVVDVRGMAAMYQGWPGFVIAHKVKMAYILTFKVFTRGLCQAYGYAQHGSICIWGLGYGGYGFGLM